MIVLNTCCGWLDLLLIKYGFLLCSSFSPSLRQCHEMENSRVLIWFHCRGEVVINAQILESTTKNESIDEGWYFLILCSTTWRKYIYERKENFLSRRIFSLFLPSVKSIAFTASATGWPSLFFLVRGVSGENHYGWVARRLSLDVTRIMSPFKLKLGLFLLHTLILAPSLSTQWVQHKHKQWSQPTIHPPT